MSDVQYEDFLSRIYDDAPYFGQARTREPELFNGFYFEHLRGRSSRVLEFGSATGMLTLPLAQAGFTVDAVDISPSMHAVLADKLRAEDAAVSGRVRQILADATTFLGDEPYDSIVMPEGIVIAIPDREMQIALFANCYRNLRRGGRVYSDFCQPRMKVVYHKTLQEHTRFRTQSGEEYLLSMKFCHDNYSQVEVQEAVFTRKGHATPSDPIALTVSFRYLYHSEIQFMLERCGFKLIDIDVNHARGQGFAVIAEKA
jgi:SAM-dependent methyltransferase